MGTFFYGKKTENQQQTKKINNRLSGSTIDFLDFLARILDFLARMILARMILARMILDFLQE